MHKRLLTMLLASCFACGSMLAQMAFSFTGLEATTAQNNDGTISVMLPSGTDLNALGQQMTVTVDGQTVNPALITPNPTTTFITDGEIEVFTYQQKAYAFRFTTSQYFTVVMFSDSHIDLTGDHAGATSADMTAYVNNIINMGKAGGKQFSFDAAPIMPVADLVLCLGDLEGDRSDYSKFKSATSALNSAGIPFVTILGNHDIEPDYYDDATNGRTFTGRLYNDKAFSLVDDQLAEAQKHGISEVTRFTDGTSHKQAKPFAFLFRGVRFYMGQTYWFQKPYSSTSETTCYVPDGVISSLETFVAQHSGEASVWAQHYPLVAGSDNERWWLDNNGSGNHITPEGTTAYPAAKDKKDKLANLMKQTLNPVHFSGHLHAYADNSYNGIADHTVNMTKDGDAFIVLIKSGEGVVEVKRVSFK